jgi:hypothetical protein
MRVSAGPISLFIFRHEDAGRTLSSSRARSWRAACGRFRRRNAVPNGRRPPAIPPPTRPTSHTHSRASGDALAAQF